MNTIGHNQPPPHEAFALEVEEMFSLVSGSTTSDVETDEQEAALDDLGKQVKALKKTGEAQRVAEKKPHDDAAKAVQAKWKPEIEKLDMAIKSIQGRVTPYRVSKQKAKDEAARKAREEAERLEREAQEKLQAANDLEERRRADAELQEAAKRAKAAKRVDRAPTGLRTQSVAVVADRKALLEYVMRNDAETLTEWLQEYARKALPSKLPGVEIEQVQRAA